MTERAHRAVDIIARKRDGKELHESEIAFIIRGYTRGEIADYQVSALLMAIYLRGMSTAETRVLVNEMLHSGAVLDLSSLGKPRVDKHSTGGVGDKTSLVIAPVVAAAGVLVPMISGRSLGHSGGTLDKLESIPGFRTDLSLDEFRKTLEQVGAALIGQTKEIAPADKKLYALRDVTATVACRPLMAASIMSKKLAEGITGLVLDVKFGSGAFLKTKDEAEELAKLMIEIAREMNREAVALMTDMNQPLGRMIGNSLEVIEALETLQGRGPEDFTQLCRELSANMLVLGKAAGSVEDGQKIYDRLVSSGAALQKMREIIQAQGGDQGVVDDYELLPKASAELPILANADGVIHGIDAEAIGRASMIVGAGRTRLETEIDHGVGIRMEARIGDEVTANTRVATILYNRKSLAEHVSKTVQDAFVVGKERVEAGQLIRSIIK